MFPSSGERNRNPYLAHKTLYTLSRFLLLTRRIRAREIRRFSTLMRNILICIFLSFFPPLFPHAPYFIFDLFLHGPRRPLSVHPSPSFPARRRLTHSRRCKNAARDSLSLFPECAGRVCSKGSGCLVCKEPLKWCSLLSEDLERRCEERHAESYT